MVTRADERPLGEVVSQTVTRHRRIRFARHDTDRGAALLDIGWVALGAPIALVVFALLVAIQFPFGGGVAHALFAYRPGGNIGAQRTFASAILGVLALVTYTLRRSHFPLPWYGTAILVTAFAAIVWLNPVMSHAAGRAFRTQGYLLLPLFPLVAAAVARYGIADETSPTTLRVRRWLWGLVTALCLAMGLSVAALTGFVTYLCWNAYVPIRARETGA